MADTTTTNLSLTKPELDVSTNWGQKLNANLDAIDAIFSGTGTAVSLNIDGGDIASAVTINKSPVITLGGDLTGNVTLTNLASGTLSASLVAESVQDIVGPMFSSNTENGISVGYEDSDGTIDLSVLVDDSSIEINSLNNTLNVKASGVTNAMLAGSIANSKLSNSSIAVGVVGSATAISLGGTITFSGTSNEVEVAESSGTITISLPTTINANTTGSAATLTTARNIGGVSFDGSADITPTTFAAATFSGDVTVDTNTLKVDTTNNRVGILNASPDVSLDVGSATDAVHVPVGTTAQRPTGANGYFRYNSDDAQFEGYADGAWGAIAGGGGGTAPAIDTMTGDGSDTTLSLSAAPTNENATFVTLDGVLQHKDTYAVSGTTLTFSTAPPSGVKVECITLTTTSISTATSVQDADGDTKIQVEESSDEDTIRMDIAGTEVLTLTNSAMTLKGTTPTLTIGDAGAEDTKIVFDGNAQDFYIGLDDSADDLIIGKGSTVGTTPAIGINENQQVCINGAVYNLSGGGTNYGQLAINGSSGGIIDFANDGVLQAFILSDAGSMQFGASTDVPVLFLQNNAERFRVTSDGIKIAAGKGIDFSANANTAGMTSELLDDYEEGTWTPSDQSGGGLTFSTIDKARYTKIGRYVMASARVDFPTNSDGNTATISLPITPSSDAVASVTGGVIIEQSISAGVAFTAAIDSTSGFRIRSNGVGAFTNAQCSGGGIRFTIHYITD